jgi:hypothetical protein
LLISGALSVIKVKNVNRENQPPLWFGAYTKLCTFLLPYIISIILLSELEELASQCPFLSKWIHPPFLKQAETRKVKEPITGSTY